MLLIKTKHPNLRKKKKKIGEKFSSNYLQREMKICGGKRSRTTDSKIFFRLFAGTLGTIEMIKELAQI